MIELLFARRASSVAYAPDRERDLALDGLRACAALSVLVAHIWSNAPWSTDVGQSGIRLFFAISGYCIFLSIDLAKHHSIGHFVVRRVFRLYPAYWLSILLALVLLETNYPLSQILANTTMVQRLFGASDIVNVYWTLFYELIFYAIACAMIFAGYIRRIDATLMIFGGTLALALLAGMVRGFLGLKIPIALFIFVSLFLGGGLMYLVDSRGLGRTWRVWLSSVVYIAILYLVPFLVSRNEAIGEGTWFQYGQYSAVAVVVFMLGTGPIRITNRPLAYLGQISYSVYLLHVIVIHWVYQLFGPASESLPKAIFAFALTLAVSALIYTLIERPFIEAGRQIARNLVRTT